MIIYFAILLSERYVCNLKCTNHSTLSPNFLTNDLGYFEEGSQSFGNISSSCLKESLFPGKQNITKNVER